jgi:F0F1-type ATP synthase assembly protein I
VTRNTLLVDLAIAVAITVLLLIVLPGLAVVAILAVLVVLVCGITFALGAWRRRRARYPRGRTPPSRRTQARR